MIQTIAKLNEIADKLDDRGKLELADSLDKVASFLMESYKPRIKRQRKTRGIEKVKRRQRYKRLKQKIKRKQKKYRRIRKTQLKRRRKMIHHKRVG